MLIQAQEVLMVGIQLLAQLHLMVVAVEVVVLYLQQQPALALEVPVVLVAEDRA
jgi:hypothetical protein